MDNVIDLEAYRSQKMEEEIEDLKQELKELVADMEPILPDPSAFFTTVYDEAYLSSPPLAGSYFGNLNFCPCCGYDYSKVDLFAGTTKDES